MGTLRQFLVIGAVKDSLASSWMPSIQWEEILMRRMFRITLTALLPREGKTYRHTWV